MMTNGEQSFGTILWIGIGAIAAIALAGGNAGLAGLGIALGLFPVMLLCNNFSKVERREQRRQYYRANHRNGRRR